MKNQRNTVECQICKKEKRMGEVVPAELVRDSIIQTIRKSHPDWSASGYICIPDLNRFRAEHVRKVLETEKGEVAELELQVINSLKEQEFFAHNMNVEYDTRRTFGERLADRIAEFGGSWGFILLFGAILIMWIAINSIALLLKPFDPYPYILLNLVLSCLAAIQAPVIMMSQNRQEGRDRLRSEHDYQINLKAELEIRNLHEKMDHLLLRQWQKLMEIQQIQMDLMEEIARKSSK
ncbi:MAG: hypothetical protein A2Z40_05310 [Deltaproteobacteria bacterium RBG_19FT_COMBO_60_16]|nr:MAG: hypothetical protein A2Z40_05310 [Deltaproteobacteria bacterium RBG_19FT_COMBO_60_16]